MLFQRGPVTLCLLLALAVVGQHAAPPLAGPDSGCFGDFRYRFESADEGGFDANADASNLLSRLGCRVTLSEHLELMAEGSNVRALGPARYNPVGDPERSRFPVVADPEDNRLARHRLRDVPFSGCDQTPGAAELEPGLMNANDDQGQTSRRKT